MYQKNWAKSLFILSFLFSLVQLNAQNDLSPLSRYGLGNLNNLNGTHLQGMGNISASYHDPLHVNVVNPASYAHLKSATYDVSLYAKYSTFTTDKTEANYWSGALNSLTLAFPLKNPINEVLHKRKKSDWDLGMLISIMPMSNVGYNASSSQTDVDFGVVTYNYKGDGGTYQFNWGNAVKYKDLSVGLNIGYLFGKVDYERSVVMNQAGSFNNILTDNIRIGGANWKLGAQYDIIFKKKTGDKTEPNGKFITIGAYGNSAYKFNINAEQYYRRESNSFLSASGTTLVDTLLYNAGSDVKGKMPAQFGAGITIGHTDKYRLGIDYNFMKWSKYSNPVGQKQGETLVDAWQLGVGGEYLPNIQSYDNYLNQVRYRFGFFTGQDYRQINGNAVNKTGVTLGMGLPIIIRQQNPSTVNFAVEFGQLNGQSIKENYIRLMLGFSLNDNSWFYKQRFR